jgi:glutamate-1-semialdehyde aminotransferase
MKTMPSGVAHDGRAFSPFPFYVARAAGARKWDIDGHEYIDCLNRSLARLRQDGSV